MSCKPILFSTQMVQAILAGRKTQTRLVIKPQPDEDNPVVDIEQRENGLWLLKTATYRKHLPCDGKHYQAYEARSKYQAGDVLWVRETWGVGTRPDPMLGWVDGFEYKADEMFMHDDCDTLPLYQAPECIDLSIYEGRGWCPSIYMPRSAARIFLRVTDVRVEQLRAITPEDKRAEGFSDCSRAYPCGEKDKCELHCFMKTWDSLNAKRGFGWAENPWVWVIEFERVVTS